MFYIVLAWLMFLALQGRLAKYASFATVNAAPGAAGPGSNTGTVQGPAGPVPLPPGTVQGGPGQGAVNPQAPGAAAGQTLTNGIESLRRYFGIGQPSPNATGALPDTQNPTADGNLPGGGGT